MGAAGARPERPVIEGPVHIAMTDDGHDFPFHGPYDHATRAAGELGPVTLAERLALLGGEVTIASEPGASRLDIMFPVRARDR